MTLFVLILVNGMDLFPMTALARIHSTVC